MMEIDGSQIMSKSVFEASGHLGNFADPIIKCTKCNSTYRAERKGEYLGACVQIIPHITDEIKNRIIRDWKCKYKYKSISWVSMDYCAS